LHLVGKSDHGGEALGGVLVLELVEDTLSLDLGVDTPLLEGGGGDACGQALGAEGVVLGLHLQPVHALGEALEGGGGGVHAVVAGVGLVGQAQGLPVLEHHVAQRAFRSLLGVGRAKHCGSSNTGGRRKVTTAAEED
jgi:hypothetical protein